MYFSLFLAVKLWACDWVLADGLWVLLTLSSTLQAFLHCNGTLGVYVFICLDIRLRWSLHSSSDCDSEKYFIITLNHWHISVCIFCCCIGDHIMDSTGKFLEKISLLIELTGNKKLNKQRIGIIKYINISTRKKKM